MKQSWRRAFSTAAVYLACCSEVKWACAYVEHYWDSCGSPWEYRPAMLGLGGTLLFYWVPLFTLQATFGADGQGQVPQQRGGDPRVHHQPPQEAAWRDLQEEGPQGLQGPLLLLGSNPLCTGHGTTMP